MSVRLHKGSVLAALNVTPLIDVVFLLLIFFLVATRFAEADRELEVLLPTATKTLPLTVEPQALFVNIDHLGRMYIGGQRVDEVEVERVLEQAVANNPVNQSVIIRADRRVPLQFAVTVMNLCNKAGVADYKLTTKGDD